MRSFHPFRSIRFWVLSFAAVVAALTAARAAVAATPAVQLDVGLARPVLLAGQRNTAEMRVSLRGQESQQSGSRPQANVCIAIDRSGSMAGEKLANARAGALSALGKLREGDYVSVVAYDDVVRVVVPATRATDRGAIEAGIAELTPGGNTALFAGVVKCADEVRKYASRNRVNRILLLSDGMANVGPSSPAQLGALGDGLAAEGISVATIGLGLDYNEDLMTELAMRSDGSHVFVEHASDLGRFLEEELGAVTAVVARDVEVKIHCQPGTRPVRVLGRRAEIIGQTVTTRLGKIYGRRQHFFVVELEVPAGNAGASRPLADVSVGYRDLLANRDTTVHQPVAASFTTRSSDVEKNVNPAVISELSLLNADLETERAIQLRDQGDIAGAQRVLQKNADDLDAVARKYKDERLVPKVRQANKKASDISNAPASSWPVYRKVLKKEVYDDPLEGLKF
jgi:Ca-activated chloride channel family protein